MSLRWSSYVTPVPQRGSQKHKTADFRKKIGFRFKKVCYKISLCENCQQQSCKAFIGLTNRGKMIGGGATPSTWNFGSKWPRWSEIADFRSVFTYCDSAVTPSEKSSINTNRKSTSRFPMSLRWSSYVTLKPPKGAQKLHLLLITIGSRIRAFDWYRPRWPWMTLNAVIALILHFLPNSTDFQADYVTVVEDRPIMSVKCCLPFPVFRFWPNYNDPAARSLCDSWASC